LRQFYRSLPPIINVSKFTFNKNDQTRVTANSAGRYVGQVTIEIFGSSIPSSDVDEIAQYLGKLCFTEGKSMSIDE
jgi:hypothetical protein